MANYYYTLGSYQAAWSTSNSTTALNDGAPGDTSTYLTYTSGTPVRITAFFDFGSAVTINTCQFTEESTSSPTGAPYILEGSTNTTSWTTIASGNAVIRTGFQTISLTGLSGSYRYYRLSVQFTLPGATTLNLSDWRINGQGNESPDLMLLGCGCI